MKMRMKSKKDESDERDEPIVSEDELDHEVILYYFVFPLDCIGLDWIGSDRIGSDWMIGFDRIGSDWMRLDD